MKLNMNELRKENKRNRKRTAYLGRILAGFIFILSLSLTPEAAFCVQASETGTQSGVDGSYDTSWLGGKGNQTFDDLTSTVQETGNSMYKLVMAIGVVGVLLAVIVCGLLIAVGTNANKRSEHIGHLVMIMVGGILIFGAVAIVGMLQTIGGNIG